jgi:hypothetical protein
MVAPTYAAPPRRRGHSVSSALCWGGGQPRADVHYAARRTVEAATLFLLGPGWPCWASGPVGEFAIRERDQSSRAPRMGSNDSITHDLTLLQGGDRARRSAPWGGLLPTCRSGLRAPPWHLVPRQGHHHFSKFLSDRTRLSRCRSIIFVYLTDSLVAAAPGRVGGGSRSDDEPWLTR